MQPGRDRRVAAKAARPPERRDHGVLERVRRLFGVTEGPDRDGPQPLPVTAEQGSEGVGIAADLAQIYAWTGEKAAAVDQIAAIEKVPNLLTYGHLKLHPLWDDLRGDLRFEALVASLAPKL